MAATIRSLSRNAPLRHSPRNEKDAGSTSANRILTPENLVLSPFVRHGPISIDIAEVKRISLQFAFFDQMFHFTLTKINIGFLEAELFRVIIDELTCDIELDETLMISVSFLSSTDLFLRHIDSDHMSVSSNKIRKDVNIPT